MTQTQLRREQRVVWLGQGGQNRSIRVDLSSLLKAAKIKAFANKMWESGFEQSLAEDSD